MNENSLNDLPNRKIVLRPDGELLPNTALELYIETITQEGVDPKKFYADMWQHPNIHDASFINLGREFSPGLSESGNSVYFVKWRGRQMMIPSIPRFILTVALQLPYITEGWSSRQKSQDMYTLVCPNWAHPRDLNTLDIDTLPKHFIEKGIGRVDVFRVTKDQFEQLNRLVHPSQKGK